MNEDKEDEDKCNKSKGNAITPRGGKEARQIQHNIITLAERPNAFKYGDFKMPWYHRRGRVPPDKLRNITEHMVQKWKTEESGIW